jgi:isopentenyl-diphosphate delta-isomerase
MQLILVNEKDEAIGEMEKIEAHEKGLLHRAFSVFIFNKKGEMLLQKRADTKYHSPKLWTNACCSHPQPGEDIIESATNRLQEEMGFTTTIIKAFDFVYNVPFENGLTEHEFDHVFIGNYNGDIKTNPDEVSDYCYKSMKDLRESVIDNSRNYTEWFKIAFPKLETYLATSPLV